MNINQCHASCLRRRPRSPLDIEPCDARDMSRENSPGGSYLSIDRLLKAPSHRPVVVVRQSGRATGVRVPGALLAGVSASIRRLGALLDRVGSLRRGRPQPRLDPGDLVDLNLGLRRVLDVNVHQRRVKRNWGKRDTSRWGRRTARFVRCLNKDRGREASADRPV